MNQPPPPPHLPPLLHNGILPMQWMSHQCCFPEHTLLRKIVLITFPHINHSTSPHSCLLGGGGNAPQTTKLL